ncbi:MAG: hypothetical protein CMP34_04370 [Rickettsiales bacterium]|nr:hypothetical protein [Rickettsiales bacterium]
MKKNIHHNLIILGAGLIGMVLALRLAKEGIKVCLVEKKKSSAKDLDGRTTAISKGSSLVLRKIGAWDDIEKNSQKIQKIIVSEGLSNHKLEFDPKTQNYDSMGYIVDNNIFKGVLEKLIKKNSNVIFENNFDVVNLDLPTRINRNKVVLKTKGKTLSCNLLLAADGRFSKTRFHAEIKHYYHDYNQTAYVFNIKHKEPHQALALERFFPSGPLALLPMKSYKNKKSSVVWTVENSYGNLLKLSHNQFLGEFKKRYKNFFGEIEFLSKPIKFNLNVFSCYKFYNNNIVLVGDACQAIHPIAGQGFNLGVRDSDVLADSLSEAKNLGLEFENEFVLKNYSTKRIADKFLLIQATHNLNKLFSINSKAIGFIRNLGLNIFNKSKFLKKHSMLYAMGVNNFEI